MKTQEVNPLSKEENYNFFFSFFVFESLEFFSRKFVFRKNYPLSLRKWKTFFTGPFFI